ncbi:MAG: lysophospholipid acyltransferase family protein [Janthinobacterium lividum]
MSIRRRFRAVRISGFDTGSLPHDRPLIIYGNHPSWWDPALYLLLADLQFRGRPGFGPMEEEALGRYGFFRRLGIFGIDKHSAAGARRFLSVARQVLSHPGGPGGRMILWVTAEGDFTDPRVRPIRLRPGIAHLAALLPDALLVPLASEYVFWNESRPELLLRLGTPLSADRSVRPAEWTSRLERGLTETMDQLALDSQARNPARFTRLLLGSAGVGGPYDLWRRLRARLSGQRITTAHGEEA